MTSATARGFGECDPCGGGWRGGQVCRHTGNGKTEQNEDVFTGICQTSAGNLMANDVCVQAADDSRDCPAGTRARVRI